MTIYFEVCSKNRNRTLWPHPSEFDVLVSAGGRKSSAIADDPVSLASPLLEWTSLLFNSSKVQPKIKCLISEDGIGNTTSNRRIVLKPKHGTFQYKQNYYRNAILKCQETRETFYTKILSYNYLGANKGLFETEDSIVLNDNNAYDIVDPTDFSNTASVFLFVPAGSRHDETYTGLMIYNETLRQFARILSYKNSILQFGGIKETWANTHNYSIRTETPILTSYDKQTSATTILIPSSLASTTDNIYAGWFVRAPCSTYVNNKTSEQRRVISYSAETFLITVSPAFSSIPINGIELMQFSYDNSCPAPIKAIAPQNDIPTYTVKLIEMIIPNHPLNIIGGGKTWEHNYLYVELSSGEANSSNSILSNNPAASRADFIVNLKSYDKDPCYIITKSNMVQTIKFRLDSIFHIKITTPSGDLLRYKEQDNLSPLEPILNLQLQLVFEFTQKQN
jgi:hypothetical protein